MTSNPAHHALFVLSNTLTIVPYIFFLSISKEQTLFAILAFVLYYTFKMTGVFFLQTLPQFSTSALLTISLWIGTVGALFGIFSMVWGSAILPAAALIGGKRGIPPLPYDEPAVIRIVEEAIAQGFDNGRIIAERLNEAGYQTKAGKAWDQDIYSAWKRRPNLEVS
mgnify:CR=1 FL=1